MNTIKELFLNIKMRLFFRKKRYVNFPYASVFPPGNHVSAWISVIALITNELNIVNRNLFRQFKGHRSKGTFEVPYYLWLACSHYREAAKFLGISEQNPEISSFIQSLPESIKSQYREVKSTYEPFEGSFVETAIKPVRDTFFHYSKVDSTLWESLWAELRNEHGELSYSGNSIDSSNWEFAEDIRINMIEKSLENSNYSIDQVVPELAHMIVNMVVFGQNVVTEYFSQVPNDSIFQGRAKKNT